MSVVQEGNHQAALAGWKCESPLLSPASIIHDEQEALEGKEKKRLYLPIFSSTAALFWTKRLSLLSTLQLLLEAEVAQVPFTWPNEQSMVRSREMQPVCQNIDHLNQVKDGGLKKFGS